MRIVLLCILLIAMQSNAQQPIIYLFPGQGADHRAFKGISIEGYELKVIDYPVPKKGASMRSYAEQLLEQVDTTRSYSFFGVSLGGMICVELSAMTDPDHVILFSSAKCREELPKRYTFMRKLPLYRMFPGQSLIVGAVLAQPFFEPTNIQTMRLFWRMVTRKHPIFMKRAVRMVVTWDREEAPDGIVHFHGKRDHTIPSKNIENATLLDGGHMIILEKPELVNELITRQLNAPTGASPLSE